MMSRILSTLAVIFLIVMPASGGGRACWLDRSDDLVIPSDLKIETMIREQLAYTAVRQTFRYDGVDSSRVFFGFDLPQNAVVTDLRWKINGVWSEDADGRSNVTIVGNAAEHRMLPVARRFGSTPLLRVFPQKTAGNAIIEVEIVYVQLMTLSRGRYSYSFPSGPERGAQNIPISRWLIDLRSKRPIEHSTLVGIEADSAWTGQGSFTFLIEDAVLKDSTNGLVYVLRNEDLQVNLISTKRRGEDGYALVLVDPESTADSGDVMPKRFTFVIDHSGSMSGERIEQAKQAAEYCLRRLNYGDLLNVIKFDTYSESWRSQHVPMSAEMSEEASTYVRNIKVRGGTDIMQALQLALSRHEADAYVNVIIFLTDGQASVDHRSLVRLNTSGTRIFVFGVGEEVKEADLIRIAAWHNGTATFIKRDPEIKYSVSELFMRINEPLVKDPVYTFQPNVVHSILPEIAPDIYRGEQTMFVARYSVPGENTVTVSGSDVNGPISVSFAAVLNDDPNLNDLIERIWARFRVEQLIEQLKTESTSSSQLDLKRELAVLSLQHGFVTPFTQFNVSVAELDEEEREQIGVLSADARSVLMLKDRCQISFEPEVNVMTFDFDLNGLELRSVKVEVLDLAGQQVVQLADVPVAPPTMKVTWNVTEDQIGQVPFGTYYLSLTANGHRLLRTFRYEK